MKPKLVATICRSQNEGFILPTAMALGTIAIFIAIVALLRSQSAQNIASARTGTSQSLAVAEAGISRYQIIINSNRAIATYCANSSAQSPCNSGTTWSNITGAIVASSDSSNNLCTQNTPTNLTSRVAAVQAAASTSTWQNIDSNADKGQYRLVSYVYTPNSGVTPPNAPGTGILIVEGRLPQSGSSSSATTRVQVSFPISTPSGSNSITCPGFWAQDFEFSNSSARIYANVRDASALIGGSSFSPSPYLASATDPTPPAGTIAPTYQAKSESIDFPDLPYNNTYPSTDPPGIYVNPASNNCDSGSMPLGVQYPRPGIDKDSNGNVYDPSTSPPDAKYYYRIGDCGGGKSIRNSSSQNITLGQSGRETIYLFVDYEISQSSTGGIVPYTNTITGHTTHVIIYANSSQIALTNSGSVSYHPKSLELYYYCTGSIKLTQAGSISGFVFAPFGTLNFTNQGGVNGAAWVKHFKNSNKGNIYQSFTDFSGLQVFQQGGTTGNTISPPQSWQLQQSN